MPEPVHVSASPIWRNDSDDLSKGQFMYTDEMVEDTTYGDDSVETAGSGHDELDYEVDGEQFTLEENADFDGDGRNDAAVIETEDGFLAVADTDGDGTADVAIQYDENGNAVGGAVYDETSGEWTEESVEALPTPSGDGADDAYGEQLVVDVPGGEDLVVPDAYDSDGDGVTDTAVMTDEDGTTYTFTDWDGDGEADEAVIVEADGDVIVAEHTAEDEWTVVERGHLDEQGDYAPDSSADAVWADR